MLLEPKLSSRPPSGSCSSTTTAETSCSDWERRRAASIVSCHPEHWQEATGIAKALSHDVAAGNPYECDIHSGSWRDSYLKHLEIARACDDWLVICGSAGRSDLGQLQRLELEVLERLLQTRSGKLVSKTGGKLLTFITVGEYRSEQVRYVESLEMELLMLKKKASSSASSCLSLEPHSMCNSHLLPVESRAWTPVMLRVDGCQYLRSFNGIYALHSVPHHGRNFYVRIEADVFNRRSSIYFSEECGGGWWLGMEKPDGKVVAAYNADKEALSPPQSNWMVHTWTGWVLEPTLHILPA
mmetsp:Transcript_81284/g.156993  ORF Transcript_81284/g.156993 Transcript_81284/m.156993 type:complete len:298 (+) Transcript_81284:94-987(+)